MERGCWQNWRRGSSGRQVALLALDWKHRAWCLLETLMEIKSLSAGRKEGGWQTSWERVRPRARGGANTEKDACCFGSEERKRSWKGILVPFHTHYLRQSLAHKEASPESQSWWGEKGWKGELWLSLASRSCGPQQCSRHSPECIIIPLGVCILTTRLPQSRGSYLTAPRPPMCSSGWKEVCRITK